MTSSVPRPAPTKACTPVAATSISELVTVPFIVSVFWKLNCPIRLTKSPMASSMEPSRRWKLPSVSLKLKETTELPKSMARSNAAPVVLIRMVKSPARVRPSMPTSSAEPAALKAYVQGWPVKLPKTIIPRSFAATRTPVSSVVLYPVPTKTPMEAAPRVITGPAIFKVTRLAKEPPVRSLTLMRPSSGVGSTRDKFTPAVALIKPSSMPMATKSVSKPRSRLETVRVSWVLNLLSSTKAASPIVPVLSNSLRARPKDRSRSNNASMPTVAEALASRPRSASALPRSRST